MRVTCYMDDCKHTINSHCGKKDGNITIGSCKRRHGKMTCCWDYDPK